VSSLPVEKNLIRGMREMKVKLMVEASQSVRDVETAIHTASASGIGGRRLVDYVFTDPPFGGNLMYSELNYLWEAWLGAFTNGIPEAVVNKTQRKALADYQQLMERCLVKYQGILKPGRWMTVEFHNSKNSVWNAIQEAVQRAGFVVADVRTFDKQQGSFNQVTASGAVKQDLIISAYKPTVEAEATFTREAGTPEGAWAFVREHLARVPVLNRTAAGVLEQVAERCDYVLYDRMVAYHLTRGATVPLSAAQFYAGLRQRFSLRDGMFFLPEQTPVYDRARLEGATVQQLALFLTDEKSAIQWLRRQLDPALGGAPQTSGELQPRFQRELHQARYEILPELTDVLAQNFVQDDRGRWRVPDPAHVGDVEQLRQRALLKEFEALKAGRGKVKSYRGEAVRAGFAACYRQRDWRTIIQVAERLPRAALEEDPDLLMYYDQATVMVG
jgi:16S rRNA G966 N2-methylase RsmD